MEDEPIGCATLVAAAVILALLLGFTMWATLNWMGTPTQWPTTTTTIPMTTTTQPPMTTTSAPCTATGRGGPAPLCLGPPP